MEIVLLSISLWGNKVTSCSLRYDDGSHAPLYRFRARRSEFHYLRIKYDAVVQCIAALFDSQWWIMHAGINSLGLYARPDYVCKIHFRIILYPETTAICASHTRLYLPFSVPFILSFSWCSARRIWAQDIRCFLVRRRTTRLFRELACEANSKERKKHLLFLRLMRL